MNEGTAVGLIVFAGALTASDQIFTGRTDATGKATHTPDLKVIVGTVIGGVMIGALARVAPELAIDLAAAALLVVALQAVPRISKTLGVLAR